MGGRTGRIGGLSTAQPIGNVREVVRAPDPTYPIDGDGEARGCRPPDSWRIVIPGVYEKEVGGIIPSWVQATPTPRAAPDPSARLVEGVLEESRMTSEDFPLKPWHGEYDWNLFVRVDPQYADLLSAGNTPGILECEWEHKYFPNWAWPQKHQRIWMMGRWIFDCGHPDDNGNYRTEIHPPKAVVSFRSEAVQFAGNGGPVRATQAVVYIGREGGYWRSSINDQDYEFRIPLPPKPSATARPVYKVESRTGRLPVQPLFTNLSQGPLAPPVDPVALARAGGAGGTGPRPPQVPAAAATAAAAATVAAAAPAAAGNAGPAPASLLQLPFTETGLDVRIPLKGVNPHPDEYGVIISVGWTDRGGSAAREIIPLTVKLETLYMDANLDPYSGDEWHVWFGVNGRWKTFHPSSIGGDTKALNHTVNLNLHPTDTINISVCGFEADELHDLMGKNTNVPKSQVSARGTQAEARAVASEIRNVFLADLATVSGGIAGGIAGLAGASWNVENEAISTFFRQEPVPRRRAGYSSTVIRRSEKGDYRLKYTITQP
jgi:hypothetical protein